MRLGDGSYVLFKNKDFGRSHLEDRVSIDQNIFGVLGMTTWAGEDSSKDNFSGFSIGANRHGLLCCDSNVVTIDGLTNYDVLVEVALRDATDVLSAIDAVKKACIQSPSSWGNLMLIDAKQAVSIEIRGAQVVSVALDGPAARSNHHLVLGFHELQEDKVTTDRRYEDAQRRLNTATSLEDIFTLQESHDDGTTGICNHTFYTTVYSYVLSWSVGVTTLHVRQGQPCGEAPRQRLVVPLGDQYSAAIAQEFINQFPTKNSTNYANVGMH